MESEFKVLPPLKRFMRMQQLEEIDGSPATVVSLCLPAKKRKESREIIEADAVKVVDAPSVSTYRLPTKKRVWALHPDLVPGKPLSPLDLNVEYKEETEEKKVIYPLSKSTEQCIDAGREDDKENGITLIGKSKREEEEEGDEKEMRISIGEDDEQGSGSGQEIYRSIVTGNQEDGDGDEDEVEEDDGILCAICQSTDGDPSDPIVFCDGCDLMVHARCYGDPLIKSIPEGDWFCAQCLASKSSATDRKVSSFSCCLCPVKEGAMKPTKDDQWAHVVCAVFVPEVYFEDPEGREGIDCSKVPKRRREGKCYICTSKRGCVIECSEPKCPLAFHVTCGLKEDLCIEYKEGKKGAVVAGFCRSHTDLWKKQQQTGKFKIVARDEHKKLIR